MAVYAAHLTRTLQGAPSVFQVVAQEALGATVKPAFGKLVEYLAAVYPDKFGWCVHWYDELFLVFDCLLQYHYLKHYAASFSETFYGLVRTPLELSGEFHSGSRLSPRAELGSLAALVLLPYARDRLERLTARWRELHEDGQLGKGWSGRARRALTHAYSTCHLAGSLCALAQLCAYAVRARSPTPALAALRLSLRAAPPQEDNQGGLLTFPWLGGLALRCVEYGAFAVQFLRWWEGRAPRAQLAAAWPPPPQRLTEWSRYTNKCPLCLQRWRTPTALPVSGLIFCYGCVSRELRARRRCPATGLPASEDDLVRVYID